MVQEYEAQSHLLLVDGTKAGLYQHHQFKSSSLPRSSACSVSTPVGLQGREGRKLF